LKDSTATNEFKKFTDSRIDRTGCGVGVFAYTLILAQNQTPAYSFMEDQRWRKARCSGYKYFHVFNFLLIQNCNKAEKHM